MRRYQLECARGPYQVTSELKGGTQDAQDVGVRVRMASRSTALSNAKSGPYLRLTSRRDSPSAFGRSVCYSAEPGGFSLARPRPYTGPSGYFCGNSCPAPICGLPGLICWTGPRLLPLIFNGNQSEVWVGQGPEWGQR